MPNEPGRLRDQAARQRDVAAGERDERSAARDEAAGVRDDTAHREHDQLIGNADASSSGGLTGLARSAHADRFRAHVDRVASANDRADAATDRQQALADRMASARERRAASLDGLTGAYHRQAGLVELDREVARAARTGRLLVVAFLDVDNLKAINDTQGHAAGDRALIAVAMTLAQAMRPYDLVIRYGGDEFLCAAEGIDLVAARLRFDGVNRVLGSVVPGLALTAGLAQWRAGESSADVISRADAELYKLRGHRSEPGHE